MYYEAHLKPLKGKYYRTHMTIFLPDERRVDIELSSKDESPSSREVEENWEWYETGEWPCDGHYERDATLIVAKEIVRRFNRDTSSP
jgi:hypothetical protein